MQNLILAMSSGAICDLVVVGILLIFAIVGIARGFVRGILGFVGTIVSLILAFLFCSKLAEQMQNWFGAWTKLSDVFETQLMKNSLFAVALDAESAEASMTAAGVPGFIRSLILNLPIVKEGAYAPGTTVASLVAPVFAQFALSAISFIIIFILIRLVVQILKSLAKKLTQRRVLGAIDKVLGLALGLVQGLLFVYFALFILVLIPAAPPKEAIENSTFTKWLNDSDFVGKLFGKLFDSTDLDDFLNDSIGDPEGETPAESKIVLANAFGASGYTTAASESDLFARAGSVWEIAAA